MTSPVTHFDLDFGITCIDVEYIRPRMACCYLIVHNGKAAIIETGTNFSVPLILQCLRDKGLSVNDVEFIIPTHVHLDHAGGVGSLMQECPQATLLIHPRGARHMIAPQKLTEACKVVYGEAEFVEMYGELVPVEESRVQIMEDKETVSLSGRELYFLDSPGHAKHHFVIYDEMSKGVFTGDIFGACYPELTSSKGPFIIPPTSPSQFDPDAWYGSLDRLMELNCERAYLTHFGAVNDLLELAVDIRRRIESSSALALGCKSAENLFESIVEALTRETKRDLQEHGCQLGEAEFHKLLAGDIEVSAQGLELWVSQM